jgi:uncharacterized protein (DUF58 family)
MRYRHAVSPVRERVGDRLLPIDWGAISPLRLRAQLVAEGVWAGAHQSKRRGAGVEFGGQRPYVPGDDLRFLDLRSLLRHDRLMVRQFETETERSLWLLVDASASMAYKSPGAPGAKLAYAALVGAALARVAVAGNDPIGLGWLGGPAGLHGVPAGFGQPAWERVVSRLERAAAAGDLSEDRGAVERAAHLCARQSGRGGIVVLLSDLLDLPEAAPKSIAALGTGKRALVVVQVLDARERELDFRGKVRLRAIEGEKLVVTDADAVRQAYKERLADHTALFRREVAAEGGRLCEASTSDDPVRVVREVLQAIAEVRR